MSYRWALHHGNVARLLSYKLPSFLARSIPRRQLFHTSYQDREVVQSASKKYLIHPCRFLTKDIMKKALKAASAQAVEGNRWAKFTSPSVGRGKTVFPKTKRDQEELGVRWDFSGEVKGDDGIVYNVFELQLNGGKVPSIIKKWRESNPRGTHAVIARVYVRKDGTKEEVEKALKEAMERVLSG